MKKFVFLFAALLCGTCLLAQNPADEYPVGPGLEFVVKLNDREHGRTEIDAIFVCMPGQGKPGAICLDVWKVL